MHAERGFTLLEVLVAFVIAGLALAVLFRGAGGSLQSVAVANHYQEALAQARSRLATVGNGVALVPRHDSGEDGDGFRWQLDITQTASAIPVRQPADATHGPGQHLALYAVQVSESWDSDGVRRHVRLKTERVGAPP
jgi:general secretion pathway protein I